MRTYWLSLAAAVLSAGVMAGCRDREQSKDDGHDHSAHASETRAAPIGPESSAVKVDLSKGWCSTHGVPESVCTRCDESLVASFKAAGDWCNGHNLPESQCVQCNPEVKAKWSALKPKDSSTLDRPSASQPSASTEGHPESTLRLLTGQRDPLCDLDKTQIRFADGTVAAKAGIEVERVEHRRMAATLEVPAEVEYDARKLVRVTPRVKGILAQADVDLGDVVNAGDVLAVIESSELGEAKSRYLELRGNLALAQADLERAEAIYSGTKRLLDAAPTTRPADGTPTEGEAVTGEAKGRLIIAQTERSLAQAAFERAARLKQDGAVSQEAFEAARGTLRKAETEHAIARDALSFESGRNLLTARKAMLVARNALDVAQRRLHLLGVSAADIADIADEAQQALSRYELRSPIAGRIIDRRAAIGEAVDERDSLYSVADLSTLWLDLNVPLNDAALVSPGQQVLFTADGLRGESFRGQLTWISTAVDDRTRTLKARAVLPNAKGLVRAKMFGTARISLHDNDEVLSVPTKAVQTDGCCQLVFIRKSDRLYEPRKVTLGSAASGYVEILDGLADGEAVVTTGSFLMKTEILKSSIGAGCCEVESGR